MRRSTGWALLASLSLLLAACSTSVTGSARLDPASHPTLGASTTGASPPPTTRSVTPSSSAELPTSSAPSTGSSVPATSDPTAPNPAYPTAIWSLPTARTVTQPSVVPGGIVVYQLVDDLLQVAAIDAVDGHVRWRLPASPGDSAPGVQLHPVLVIAGVAVYLRPSATDHFLTAVVAVDPETGRDRWVTDYYKVIDRPVPCLTSVCVTVATARGVREALILDPSTGHVDERTADEQLIGRTIGRDGLLDGYDDGERVIGRVVTGRTVWETTPASLFGPGYSTDGGWAFFHYPDRHIYVGWLGRWNSSTRTVPSPNPIGAVDEMVGVDDRTGARIWKVSGVDPICDPGEIGPDALPPAHPIRCHWSSDAVEKVSGDALTVAAGAVRMEGFDPATGTATWSAALNPVVGHRVGNIGFDEPVDADRITFVGPSGPGIIDRARGHVVPMTTVVSQDCEYSIHVDYGKAMGTVGAGPYFGRRLGSYVSGCNAKVGGDLPLVLPLPAGFGTQVGDLRIVTTLGALVAFRQAG